jgi:hypothetical protein
VASDVGTVIRQLEQVWQIQNQVARMQQTCATAQLILRRYDLGT